MYDGRLVASTSSLIVDFGHHREWHNWKAISDNGFIRSHNPDGDPLYGIEIMDESGLPPRRQNAVSEHGIGPRQCDAVSDADQRQLRKVRHAARREGACPMLARIRAYYLGAYPSIIRPSMNAATPATSMMTISLT